MSTSHLHSFTVTFVDVSPSTGDRFAFCSRHARFICHYLINYEIVIPRHFLHVCSGHIFSQERYASHLIRVISFAIVHVHTTFVELVAHVQSTHHVVVAAWIQRSVASVYCLHFHVAFSYTAGSSSRDLGIFAALPRRDALVLMDWALTSLFSQLPLEVWRMLLSEPSCLQHVSQVQDRFPFLQ